MFNNCYRQGCQFDRNRCNCPKCNNNWDKDDNKDKDFDRHECCFPMDICFSVKEGKKGFDKKEYRNEQDFDRNNGQNDYGYGYENSYDYEENKGGYEYNYYGGYDYENQRDYGKYDNQKGYEKENNKHDDKDCKHECCFPIDICFSIKESKKDFDKKDDDRDEYGKEDNENGYGNEKCKNNQNRNDWNKKDRCDRKNWNNDNNHNCNNRQCGNRNNCCCLGLLGCLFGCGRRF